jgi:uncharacterized protein YdgA (DUF945 family)
MARKLLLLILVVLVGAVVGAPFMFGVKAEQIHREFAKQLSVAGSSSLKSSDFSKGWFKSSARDEIEVCSTTQGCQVLVISSVLHHGPIALTGILDGVAPIRPLQAVMVSTVKLDGLFDKVSLKPELPNLMITTIAELDGNSRATLDMPASQHTAEGKAGAITLAQGGISGEFTGTAGTEQVQGEVKFPSLKMGDATGASLSVANVAVKVDGSGGDSGFIGRIEEKVGDITFTSVAQDPQPTSVKGLQLTLTGSRSSDGLTQNQFKGDIKTIVAAGREYGPATLDGEVLRFNRAAMTRLQKEVDALEAQKKPPEEALPALMAVYQKGIPEVLGSRPEINLKSLTIKTPEGDMSSSFKLVGVPPQGELNMGAWLTLLQAEYSLQIPAVTLWNILDTQMQQAAHKAAAQSGQPPVMPTQDAIGAKVDELVKANVFVPKLDANAYTLQVALLEGRLLINGQENQGFAGLAAALAGAQGPAAAPPTVEVAPPAP